MLCAVSVLTVRPCPVWVSIEVTWDRVPFAFTALCPCPGTRKRSVFIDLCWSLSFWTSVFPVQLLRSFARLNNSVYCRWFMDVLSNCPKSKPADIKGVFHFGITEVILWSLPDCICVA
uniref:Uncharacterized protein n=1 Tax=Anguilla anguilla TaxID=7936 RepID=A0A0E9WQ73_ANGAN